MLGDCSRASERPTPVGTSIEALMDRASLGRISVLAEGQHDDDLQKINDLIKDTKRSLHKGLGKPEPLKGKLAGWWSRRITDEHRLVYRVSGHGPSQVLEIAQCRLHY
jgi:toxin YoeB